MTFHSRLGLAAALGTVLFLAGGRAAAGDDAVCWAWMKGPSAANRLGIYGTQGVGDAANNPGARGYSVTWTGHDGTLWLFGGDGLDGIASYGWLNDLWAFDPAGGIWTWMKGAKTVDQYGIYGTQGVGAPGNTPGARYGAAGWTDASGAFWLFGGKGMDGGLGNGRLNDVWKYDPAGGAWAWMKGSNVANQAGVYGTRGVSDPANNPGGRTYAVTWTDAAGALWLFGGHGYDSLGNEGYLNDLWKFNPVNRTWTWMKGSSTADQAGVYGMPGTPADANTPGGRATRAAWTDSSGAFWLFGGYCSGGKWFNDLWKYNPASGQWAWMKGGQTPNYVGVYGTQGNPGPANNPGARAGSVAWTDNAGAFWLFGGYGFGNMLGKGELNDLWKYDPASGQWAWMKGSPAVNQVGTYGIQGVPSTGNTPGGRDYTMAWLGRGGGLWLFGGFGEESGQDVLLSDLWCCGPVYALTYTAGPYGTLAGATTQTVVRGASGAAVNAVPAPGYQFSRWSDGVTANPRRDTFVTRRVDVSAAFSLVPAVSSGVGADYDGDRLADPAWYDESLGQWRIRHSGAGYALTVTDRDGLGGPGRASVAADYDGDRLADPAVYTEQTGRWAVMLSASGYRPALALDSLLGDVGSSGMPADYDGDGRADPCVYRRENGDWTVLLSASGYARVSVTGLLGGPGNCAVAADYDGDRRADPAVYGEESGDWRLLLSGSGYAPLTLPAFLGGAGRMAAPGDYDGDGFADPAVMNPESGDWSLRLSGSGYAPLNVPGVLGRP